MKPHLKRFSLHFIATISILSFFFLVIHLYNLLKLPIFADEAIYIRWAQLIIDDWQQYLFFPLSDGKTPFYIWVLVPFQFVFANQLFAARVVSVLIGLIQMWLLGYLTYLLKGRNNTVLLAMILSVSLPFWFFYHRMSLIDGLLSVFLTLSLCSTVLFLRHFTYNSFKSKLLFDQKLVLYSIATGIFFGLALLTKVPAILFAPALLIWAFLPANLTLPRRIQALVWLGSSVALGNSIFALLALHPAFGQLFNRGSDFLYPVKEILNGAWRQTLPNIPTYLGYFITYLSFPVLLLTLSSLFSPRNKRLSHVLFWSGLLFILPITIMGRVVYARYFMPISIFFTLSTALFLQELIDEYVTKQNGIGKKILLSLVVVSFIANILAYSGSFITTAYFHPEKLPLPSSDKEQYLYEWSAGFGTKQVADMIKAELPTSKIAVATEGTFGSLPDGLLLYFHRTDVTNLYIEGIGYPVKSIPDLFSQRAVEFDKIYLVVNSHEMEIPTENLTLITQFCRPEEAPCLQVWDITSVIKEKHSL